MDRKIREKGIQGSMEGIDDGPTPFENVRTTPGYESRVEKPKSRFESVKEAIAGMLASAAMKMKKVAYAARDKASSAYLSMKTRLTTTSRDETEASA